MDLGIKGKRALICASSQGLGYACATSLVKEGVSVILNGRNEDKLTKAADSLRTLTNGDVSSIAADLSTEEGRKRLIDGAGDIDILVNNNAGPPPGNLEDWDYDALIGAMNMNMIPAALLMRAFIPGMQATEDNADHVNWQRINNSLKKLSSSTVAGRPEDNQSP